MDNDCWSAAHPCNHPPNCNWTLLRQHLDKGSSLGILAQDTGRQQSVLQVLGAAADNIREEKTFLNGHGPT